MKRVCISVLLSVGLLSACAHQGSDPALTGTGVEVYGVVDVGVGTSRQSN